MGWAGCDSIGLVSIGRTVVTALHQPIDHSSATGNHRRTVANRAVNFCRAHDQYTASSIVMQERTADFEEFLRTVPWVGDTFLPALGKDVVTDRLVLKAVGKVQLGVEMAEVADVQINGGAIRFSLPQPKVVTVEILTDQSQIIEQQHFWLLSQYAGLESAALEAARAQLQREVAADQAMLRTTAAMARMQLTNFLRKSGFATVEITFRG